MNKRNVFRVLLASVAFASVSTTIVAQNCDKYLNQQTQTVNTKGVLTKVLGKASDMLLGTSFSKFTQNLDQLQMLDNIQYQMCVKLQTVKNEFSRENLEAKKDGTLAEMAGLIGKSGVLPTDMVTQLTANGIVAAPQATAIVPATEEQTVAPAVAETTAAPAANEVPVPVLPKPAASAWTTVTFPCQSSATSAEGVIRARGMETSMDAQIAKSVANTIALEELASKIEVSVKSTTHYFINQTKTNLDENLKTNFERKIDLTVNQTIRGYRTVCEEYQQDEQGKKFRAFITLEVDLANVLQPIFNELQQQPALQQALPDFNTFEATVEQAMEFYEGVGMN